jgi:hypothetical protein
VIKDNIRKEDTMRRRTEVEILEEDLDDDVPTLTGFELGIPIDLTREDLDDDDDDDLGVRALYENPEAVLRSSRWPYAA